MNKDELEIGLGLAHMRIEDVEFSSDSFKRHLSAPEFQVKCPKTGT